MARRRGRGGQKKKRDRAAENVEQAIGELRQHPLFGPMIYAAWVTRNKDGPCPPDGWAVLSDGGTIYLHPTRLDEPEVWKWVIAHHLLHLGFAHLAERKHRDAWNYACDALVNRFLADLKFGRPPADVVVQESLPRRDENDLYDWLVDRGVPRNYRFGGTAGDHCDMVGDPHPSWRQRWDLVEEFEHGLRSAVLHAVEVAGGSQPGKKVKTRAEMARSWFISSYPLLGALAASFELIEDAEVCQRLDIHTAAVDDEAREIYLNPRAGLGAEQLRFVIAHELLHVGLRHQLRCQGRDPYLWNVACDFVVNDWLIEMEIGQPPAVGMLHDPSLRGLSAEAVYDHIVVNLRRYRKLATLRGVGVGDMIARRPAEWWLSGPGADLDATYRECLSRGLMQHQEHQRGFLPAGLIEEIQALGQPPIPWDVELARWFDERFPPLERRRTYARPSRRQASTPDIPRPRYAPLDENELRTFAVVLDTSGSMDRKLLAKALGAIASYSLSRDVGAVRLVFCDAAAYDQGYVPPETIAHRVRVKGRGGTVLQPGLDLLDEARDFPDKGPVLIITDGFCDRLRVRRDHAFLMPGYGRLPFVPKGEVFRIR